MLKRCAAFARILDDGRICLTNNAAERALRGIAMGRRNWLFAGSDRGGERAAAIYTLIATAKLNDVGPQAWLQGVLRRIANHPASRLPDLPAGTGTPKPSPPPRPECQPAAACTRWLRSCRIRCYVKRPRGAIAAAVNRHLRTVGVPGSRAIEPDRGTGMLPLVTPRSSTRRASAWFRGKSGSLLTHASSVNQNR